MVIQKRTKNCNDFVKNTDVSKKLPVQCIYFLDSLKLHKVFSACVKFQVFAILPSEMY